MLVCTAQENQVFTALNQKCYVSRYIVSWVGLATGVEERRGGEGECGFGGRGGVSGLAGRGRY